MRTWLPPITLQPPPPASPGQQNGPPAFRGTSVVFAFALFQPSNAFAALASASNTHTTSSCPKQASRPEALSASGICPVVPASAQLPDTITLHAELYHLSLQIARVVSEHSSTSTSSNPLVTKKPNCYCYHISLQRPHLEDNETPAPRLSCFFPSPSLPPFPLSGPFASSVLDLRIFALPSRAWPADSRA